VTTVYLKPKREKSLLRRHPWIFSGAIDRVDGRPQPGEVVTVRSSNEAFLAKAAWSPSSQIRLRVWTFDESATIDAIFVGERLQRAIEMRRALGFLSTSACRLVFSESDGLPGLIVDRYGDYLVCQFLSAAIETFREAVCAHLERALSPVGIVERSHTGMRRKEGLAPSEGLLSGSAPDARQALELDGVQQFFDLAGGQKTGAYLDQRVNRQRVARYAADASVLDAFSYTGGFGLYCMHAGAAHVTFLDSSMPALESAADAAQRNGFTGRFDCVTGNAGDLLRLFRDDGRSFDLIILDPPKFVQSSAQIEKGCRAYKDINRLALEVLKPGGILATFSCSSHVDALLFQKVVAQAALDAGRDAQIIERLAQPADHPVALSIPESEYLSGLIVRA